jgi:hypothetical protein
VVAVDVAGDLLSGFESATVFQKVRDAARPEIEEANSERGV